MREIKFRGKDIGGVWYIGLLCKQNGKTYISNSGGSPRAYEVRPETIGQYTGLLDKNGVEIYEGDIIELAGYGNYDCVFPFLELYEAGFEGDILGIIGNKFEPAKKFY